MNKMKLHESAIAEGGAMFFAAAAALLGLVPVGLSIEAVTKKVKQTLGAFKDKALLKSAYKKLQGDPKVAAYIAKVGGNMKEADQSIKERIQSVLTPEELQAFKLYGSQINESLAPTFEFDSLNESIAGVAGAEFFAMACGVLGAIGVGAGIEHVANNLKTSIANFDGKELIKSALGKLKADEKVANYIVKAKGKEGDEKVKNRIGRDLSPEEKQAITNLGSKLGAKTAE